MAAIEPIREGDTDALDKMNAVIAEANKVDGKAELGGLDAEVDAREQADFAEQEARIAGDELRVTYGEAACPSGRPGEPGSFATADLGGAPEGTRPIDAALKAVGPHGAVVAIRSGYVAPRAVFRIEPSRRYRVRFVVQRREDTQDPANDAIRLGLAWLGGDKSKIAEVSLVDLVDINVAAGRLEYIFAVARQVADDVDAVAPAASAYLRPFVRAYGSGLTHVEVIECADISSALEWSPDVDTVRRELAGLAHGVEDHAARLEAIEQEFAEARDRAARSAFGEITVDADAVVSATADARTIRHSATLTATRQLAIVAGGAEAGMSLHIVRTGAGGFPLDVGPGLKVMSANSWAEFLFDGEAWFLAASGSL